MPILEILSEIALPSHMCGNFDKIRVVEHGHPEELRPIAMPPAGFLAPENRNPDEPIPLRDWVGTDVSDDGRTVTVTWTLGRDDGGQGRLRVEFEAPPSLQIATVELSLPDGVRPSDLKRFAWTKWLRVAEARMALHRAGHSIESVMLGAMSTQWRDMEASIKGARTGGRPSRAKPGGTRPGRAGYPQEFYERIARRYEFLVAMRDPAPIQRIAEEEGASRDSTARWISVARKRGLLGPGLRGRAG
jgi:hypothetical protein